MVLREAGVRLTLQGEAAYRAGLKGISQEMRTVATASKLAVAQLGNNAGITDTYNAKVKAMGSEMKIASTQSQVLTERQRRLPQIQKEITTSLEATNKVYKESATRTKELDVAYQKSIGTNGRYSSETIELGQALESSKQETKALEVEVNNLTKAFNNNEKELAKLPNELAKAELATQKLRNESQKLHDEWRNQGGRLADTAKQWQDVGNTLTTVGNKLTTVGSQMTTKVTLPIVTGMGLAVKGAAAFQTEMGTLLPLIAEGGNITEEHRAQVEQLGEASREMAIDYGKHTSDLNAGMAELIRNGYTSAQVLGMVPNVLDASIASGEEFQTVMGTTANVLSQFQLRGKDTNETLENTQRVVDSLTYVANATSSGFYDLGQGMAYVGPVANSLNMSVEETASILGILSDNGIEASQGGTALRGALTRLLKPSKQNAEAMAELGISTEDYKNGLIEFPEILDLIATNTAHLTDEQRAALIATAFGTEAQSAMNALVAAGGDELRNMTTAAEGATGATKEIAEAIKDTPEFQFQQSLAQLRDLGIELGSKLLPSVMKIISTAGDWVESFNSLSESTQNFIIKLALGVAAIGPLVTAIGSIYKVAGTTATGVGSLIKMIGQITTPKSVTDLGKDMTTLTTATSGATSGVKLFNTALGFMTSPAGIAVLSVAGLYAAYRALTEDARNAHSAIQEFPNIDGVTHEQAESIRDTYGAYSDLTLALDTLAGQTVSYADSVSGAVSQIVEEIERLNRNNIEGMAELYKELPPQVAAMYDELMMQEEQVGNHRINRSKQVENEITQIMDTAKEQQRQLTNAEQQYLIQARNELSALQADSLGATAEQSRQIYATLTADLANMNREQLTVHEQNIQSALENMSYGFEQTRKNILDTVGKTNPEAAEMLIQELETVYDISRNKMMTEWAKTLEAQGEMTGLAGDQLYNAIAETMNQIIPGLNILPEEVERMLTRTEVTMQNGVDNMIQPLDGAEARVQEAAQKFNSAIMEFANSIEEGMSPENLNADQLDQFMQQINDLGVTWHDLKFMQKSPYIDDNVKEFINRIVEAHGGWEAIEFAENQASIRVLGMDELEEIITLFGVDFASLTDDQKTALIEAKGAKEISDHLYKWGIWVASDPAEAKQAVIETDDALMQFQPLLESLGLWNDTEFLGKYVDIDTNAPDAQEKITSLISEWTGLPVEEVKSMMTETNADESTSELKDFEEARAGIPPESRATFTTDVGGVGADAEELETYKGAVEGVPESKSSSLSTNIFETFANTLAVLAYNAATGAMEDKDVSADTSIPWMIRNTEAVLAYNSAVNAMRNKSSTLTTNTPNIALNTSRALSWVRALNSAYNRTSTLTTVYRTQGSPARGFATGGHIDAYAEGGDIKWGGLFAGGAQNVPKGYMGIVGEAGPEMFHVTRDGVNITPLSPGEKMRGVEGAIEDYLGKAKGGGDTHFHIEINGPVVKEKQDINALAREVSREIGKRVNNRQKGWSVQL